MKDETKFTLIILFAFASILSNFIILSYPWYGFISFPCFGLSIIMIRKFRFNDKIIPDGSEFKIINEEYTK